MSEYRIAYPAQVPGIIVSILHPTSELSLEETALKDTPTGLPFKYVLASDIPADAEARAEWSVDFSDPDGYGA